MKPVKAALVNQNCLCGQFSTNIKNCIDLAEKAAASNSRYIIFPEMNLTGYATGPTIKDIAQPISQNLINTFSDLSKDLSATLIVGLAEKTEKNKIFATQIIFTPSGYQTPYRKIHTAPYEQQFFSSGKSIEIYKTDGLNFSVQLCYDAHFPELSLAMALKKVDVIFIPHASPRSTAKAKYESWLRHLRARAFDNGVFIAACNQVGKNGAGLEFPGVSLLIGPDGNVISKSLGDQPQIHIVEIDPAHLDYVRSHKMRYFLPNRRNDIFNFKV